MSLAGLGQVHPKANLRPSNLNLGVRMTAHEGIPSVNTLQLKSVWQACSTAPRQGWSYLEIRYTYSVAKNYILRKQHCNMVSSQKSDKSAELMALCRVCEPLQCEFIGSTFAIDIHHTCTALNSTSTSTCASNT